MDSPMTKGGSLFKVRMSSGKVSYKYNYEDIQGLHGLERCGKMKKRAITEANHTYSQCRTLCEPNIHIYRLWEKVGVAIQAHAEHTDPAIRFEPSTFLLWY